MRLAVISDMHGNCIALDAVLADIRQANVDQIVCLGDAVQGGPQPKEVVQRLREIGCPVVMGNADDWLITGQHSGSESAPSPKQIAAREWSMTQLSADDIAFIQTFQPTVKIDLGAGKSFLGFHGSPTSFNDIILPTTPEADVEIFLGAFRSDILAGGHTHMQQIRRIGDSFFFNPGSVGFAYSHYQPENQFRADAWAEYAILSAAGGQIGLEFRRVPFDVNALIQMYRSSGRPYADDSIAQYRP